jgi:putative Mg2+ transporter-C (MgtC) family protein
MNLGEMVLKLLLAFLAGGLVGLEREQQDRPAGLRTHMLVCGGSLLFTLISLRLDAPGDHSRIAAQIVSGIGFLGAGTIFRSGSAVRGLTTAAGLWTVAAIGMGIGAGGALLYLALITAGCIFTMNHWLKGAEERLLRTRWRLLVRGDRHGDVLVHVFGALDERQVQVQSTRWLTDECTASEFVVELLLNMSRDASSRDVLARVSTLPGVRQVEWS